MLCIHLLHQKLPNYSNKNSNEREDIRWVIYTDSFSSMLTIENNRKVKGNEEGDKAAKQQ